MAQDHVRRVSLKKKGSKQFIQACEVWRSNVETGSGFDKDGFIVPVSCDGLIVSLIEAAGAFAVTAVADKRSLIKVAAMIAAGNKVLAVGIAVMAEPAESFADRGKETADVFLFAVIGKSTKIGGFVEKGVLLKGTVFFNFFGDSGGILG